MNPSTAVTGPLLPQYEVPQYEVPQYEVPQYEMPQYELSGEERHLLDLTATPAATLLGLVSMSLRTTLFGTDPAAWVDMWQAGPTNARLEWQDGPELAVVVAHLAARTYDGNLEGVPGLRPLTHTQYAAQMTWLATPDPVTLHLTRLD